MLTPITNWIHRYHIKKSLIFVTLISLLFYLLIGFDIIPLLRGPVDWHWSYLFINTFPKIFPALLLIGILLYFFSTFDKKKDTDIPRYEKIFLPLGVFLGFLLQLSVIYFSRAGIFVLLARTIEPVNNGYFTASLTIDTLSQFLSHYNELLATFPLHPSQHPPGGILFYYFFQWLFTFFPFLHHFVNGITISTKSIFEIWLPLLPNQKEAALFTGFFMPLFASALAIPLYYAGKLFGTARVALRSAFMYLFLPSIVLFTPLPDVLFSVFTLGGLLFFILAIKKNNPRYVFLVGLMVALGIFCSLSLLSIGLLFFIALLIQYMLITKYRIILLKSMLYLTLGIVVPFIALMLFFQFNILTVATTIHNILVREINNRSYTEFLFYNLYDFLIFAGIPVFFYFIYTLKDIRKLSKENFLLLSFIATLLIMDFSGTLKGETSRLLIPFYPFLVLLTTGNLCKQYKFQTRDFLVIYALMGLQILVMQEFWVTLW